LQADGFGEQIIKSRGGTVIGTTSTPEKADIAKAHGADHVILYKKEDTVQRVKGKRDQTFILTRCADSLIPPEITNGRGVDAIFDGVGKDT
jgi:NADPH:quinone reductase